MPSTKGIIVKSSVLSPWSLKRRPAEYGESVNAESVHAVSENVCKTRHVFRVQVVPPAIPLLLSWIRSSS